jgi:hypothetical protein
MAIGHPAIASSVQTCWACPEQYEGQLIDGQFFYFRYRFGCATLGVGRTLDEASEDPCEVHLRVGDNLRGTFGSTEERDIVFARLLLDRELE